IAEQAMEAAIRAFCHRKPSKRVALVLQIGRSDAKPQGDEQRCAYELECRKTDERRWRRSISTIDAAPLSLRHERMYREHVGLIGPGGAHLPARAARQRCKALEAVFVAVLGVNALAVPEREARSQQTHHLLLLADQVHLDPVPLAVVDRAMG